MDDLVTWLREQIAADQRTAQAAMESQRHAGDPDGTDTWRVSGSDGIYTTEYGVVVLVGPHEYLDPRLGEHIVTWHPKRVLAQCEAHELILTLAETVYVGYAAVKALGLAYQHRPGYREEWR